MRRNKNVPKLISHKPLEEQSQAPPPTAPSRREEPPAKTKDANAVSTENVKSGRKPKPTPPPPYHSSGNVKIVPLMESSKQAGSQSDSKGPSKMNPSPQSSPEHRHSANIQIVPLMEPKRPQSWSPLDDHETRAHPRSPPHHHGNIKIVPLMEPKRSVSPDSHPYTESSLGLVSHRPPGNVPREYPKRAKARAPPATTAPQADSREQKVPRSLSPTPHHHGNIKIVPLMEPKRSPSPDSHLYGSTPPRSSSPHHHSNIKIVPLMEPKKSASPDSHPRTESSPGPVSHRSPHHQGNVRIVPRENPERAKARAPPATTPPQADSPEIREQKMAPHRHGNIQIVPLMERKNASSEESRSPQSQVSRDIYPVEPKKSKANPKSSVPVTSVTPTAPKSQKPSSHSGTPASNVRIVPMMTPVNSPLGKPPKPADTTASERQSNKHQRKKAGEYPLGPAITGVEDNQRDYRKSPKTTSSPLGPIAVSVDVSQGKAKGRLMSLDKHGGLGPAPRDAYD